MDNTELNAGSGGDIISTDDISGVKVQRVKVQIGADGSASDVHSGNPLPVTDAGGSLTVDGTVAISNTSIPVTDNGGSLTVDGSVSITGTAQVTTSATNSGTLGALNAAVSLALSGAGAAGFVVATGLTATIKPQFSYDAGTTWVDSSFFLIPLGSTQTTRALAAATQYGQIDFPAGATHVRIIVSAYTSGSASCTVNVAAAPQARILPQGTSSSSLDTSMVVSFAPSSNAVKLTDGNNVSAVKAASTAAAATDPALVVSPNPLSAGIIQDNATTTDGTTRVVMAGFALDETAGTALTENDGGFARMDSKRAQILVIEDATTRGRRMVVSSTGAALVDLNGVLVSNSLLCVRSQPIQSTTPVSANVSAATSVTTLQGSNAARLGLTVYNDSSSALYLKLGASASTTSFTVLIAANGYYEVPFSYTGTVTGVWATATGNARVTELT